MDVGKSYKNLICLSLIGFMALSGCEPSGGQEAATPPQDKTSSPDLPSDPAGAKNSRGATLKAIRARGDVRCGVHPGLVGFSYRDNRGTWKGFDTDFCRATAMAVLGDASKVRFIPLETTERFKALKSGQVDVLWRSTSWILSRDTADGLNFVGVNYYDGQGFLVRRALKLNSVTELNGARICVQAGSTSELNLGDFFKARGIKYTPVVVATEDQARARYATEACDAFTADISALAAARTTLDDPQNHVILPEVISKEPLGPVVREGDEQWNDIVRWTLYALILAEEFGVTSRNIDDVKKNTQNPEIKRLLGVESDYGQAMGLTSSWAYDAIKSQGNYGEIFNRNIGTSAPLNLDRGLNAQWNDRVPGLIYAPPAR